MLRRDLDRRGVAYLDYRFSDDLLDSLSLLGLDLSQERGFEADYNLALNP